MDHATGHREWVYPLHVSGKFQDKRKIAFFLLQAFLFAMPWVTWNGEQLILFDLANRTFMVAGSMYDARDTIFLVVALIFSGFALFFVTTMWGRVWCGYACPQTVFLETWGHNVERWIEGDRGKRMARDKGPWNFDKVWRKGLKWTIFLVVSFLIGMTLVAWFAGTRTLWAGQASVGAYGMVGALTAVGMANLAWFREQFCNFLCPYARFQGVIAGPNTQVVSYDKARGEPRAKGKRTEMTKAQLGSCIDCNKCTAACPNGIDIRNGYQLECIGCARCIDACAPVMEKLGQEPLVRYATQNEDKGIKGSTSVLRPRPLIYLGGMAASSIAFGLLLANHHGLDATVNRGTGMLYQVGEDGSVRNTYILSVTNKHKVDQPLAVQVMVEGIPGVKVVVPPIELATGENRKVPLVVEAPPGAKLDRTVPIQVELSTGIDEIEVNTTFKTGT